MFFHKSRDICFSENKREDNYYQKGNKRKKKKEEERNKEREVLDCMNCMQWMNSRYRLNNINLAPCNHVRILSR